MRTTNRAVSIGGPITLAVVGALLMFAVTDTQVGPLKLQTLGIILVVAGIVWLVLGFVAAKPRTVASVKTEAVSPDGNQREVRTESQVDGGVGPL